MSAYAVPAPRPGLGGRPTQGTRPHAGWGHTASPADVLIHLLTIKED